MNKKIKQFFLFAFLVLLSVTGLSSCSSKEEKEIVRTGVDSTDSDEYFYSITDSNEGNVYKTVAKKEISGQFLSDYESVSLVDDDYIITYEVVTDAVDNTVKLNVYFDNTEEVIIEDFTGIIMKNADDEEDILFTVDENHIFLSELNELTDVEQCSWFGNVLHKALNRGMIALSYLEPAIKILSYTNQNLISQLYSNVKNTTYLVNYGINSNQTQPSGFVYGQGAYSSWHFGYSNLSYAGCEVIAGYNLAKALNRNYSLASVVFLYESLGIEIGIAQGYFGSNPYQISYFLNATGINYTKTTNYKTFESYMKNSTDYYVILSRWNDESMGSEVHTFMIDKDSDYSDKYHAYNYYSNSTISWDRSDYSDFFDGSIKNTFMVAYFVKK